MSSKSSDALLSPLARQEAGLFASGQRGAISISQPDVLPHAKGAALFANVTGAIAHLFLSGRLVVWAVHHLVAVVLCQNVWVIADALYEQVLPLAVVPVSLQDPQWQVKTT